jgi:hypothetical protein
MTRAAAIVCLLGVAALPGFARAQAVAITPSNRIVVAHDSVIELFAPDGQRLIWRCDGVPYVSTIAVGGTKLAAVDAIDGRAVIVDLADGRGRVLETPGTPIDALFIHDDLFLLERDSDALERIAADGSRAKLPTGRYPQFLRRAGAKLYAYGSADGTLDEFTTAPFARGRSLAAHPFATAFELARGSAYLACPDDRRFLVFDLNSMTEVAERAVGRFPIDLALVTATDESPMGQTPFDLLVAYGKWFGQNTLGSLIPPHPVFLAVADPGRKSVFLIKCSSPIVFDRTKRLNVPTAVDRVFPSGKGWIAYDSAQQTIYTFVGKEARAVATSVGPHAFQAANDRVVYWSGRVNVHQL